jgi:hypothetical protein
MTTQIPRTFYNRYGEYDPGREDNSNDWIGRCDNCNEWIPTGMPTKPLSIHKVQHLSCPSKLIKRNK